MRNHTALLPLLQALLLPLQLLHYYHYYYYDILPLLIPVLLLSLWCQHLRYGVHVLHTCMLILLMNGSAIHAQQGHVTLDLLFSVPQTLYVTLCKSSASERQTGASPQGRQLR